MANTLDKGAEGYCKRNRELYLEMGKAIEPNREDWREVWDRLAFAILSANTRFDGAARALTFMGWRRDGETQTTDQTILGCGLRKSQLRYVEALSTGPGRMTEYLRKNESWDSYRLRLQRSVKGLGLTKATFAACLLYPTTADLACVDVHIHRLFTGQQSAPNRIALPKYLGIENVIRNLGTRAGLPTFLAQWAIWDWARGKVEDHRIWPVYS